MTGSQSKTDIPRKLLTLDDETRVSLNLKDDPLMNALRESTTSTKSVKLLKAISSKNVPQMEYHKSPRQDNLDMKAFFSARDLKH